MPTVDMPFEAALQELTGFEVIAIQQHYGTEMEHLGGIRSLCGAVWAFANRVEKTSWQQVEAMTLRQLSEYFAQPDSDPESPMGKDSTSPEPTHNGSQISASRRASRQRSTTA